MAAIHGEGLRNLGEALVAGGFGKGGVDRVVLLKFVVLRHPEQFGDGWRDVDGVTAVDGDVLPCAGAEMVVEDFGVLQLLAGGVGENRLHNVQFLVFCLRSGEGVAIARLAFAGKSTQEVEPRLALLEID